MMKLAMSRIFRFFFVLALSILLKGCFTDPVYCAKETVENAASSSQQGTTTVRAKAPVSIEVAHNTMSNQEFTAKLEANAQTVKKAGNIFNVIVETISNHLPTLTITTGSYRLATSVPGSGMTKVGSFIGTFTVGQVGVDLQRREFFKDWGGRIHEISFPDTVSSEDINNGVPLLLNNTKKLWL